MCTVTFLPRRKGYCLGMNRDEKRSRAKGLPPSVRTVGSCQVVYPSEPNGGTWIALREQGVSFALVNWYGVNRRVSNHPISRGTIIPSLADSIDLDQADARIAALPLPRFNPFRLVGVFPDAREIIEWRWDLIQLTRSRPGWRAQQWISSGFDEPGAQKSRGQIFKRAQTQTSAGTVEWLRRLHRSHSPASGAFSTCVHRADAATVSYTEVIVSDAFARMWHINGPPCGRCDQH